MHGEGLDCLQGTCRCMHMHTCDRLYVHVQSCVCVCVVSHTCTQHTHTHNTRAHTPTMAHVLHLSRASTRATASIACQPMMGSSFQPTPPLVCSTTREGIMPSPTRQLLMALLKTLKGGERSVCVCVCVCVCVNVMCAYVFMCQCVHVYTLCACIHVSIGLA